MLLVTQTELGANDAGFVTLATQILVDSDGHGRRSWANQHAVGCTKDRNGVLHEIPCVCTLIKPPKTTYPCPHDVFTLFRQGIAKLPHYNISDHEKP